MTNADNAANLLAALEKEFKDITHLAPVYSDTFASEALRLAEYLSSKELLPFEERRLRFLAHMNWKFRINANALNGFYALAARRGYTFNYHQKTRIQMAFDSGSRGLLEDVLRSDGPSPAVLEELKAAFVPAPASRTVQVLKMECESPTHLRKPAHGRNIAGEILQTEFAAFLFCCLTPKEMHRHFDPEFCDNTYQDNFLEELRMRAPRLFARDNALYLLLVDQGLAQQHSNYSALRGRLCAWVRKVYNDLNNYSYLAILIKPLWMDGRSIQAELAADLTLFGEKHRETPLDKAYFRWRDVQRITQSYIAGLNLDAARFDLANEGYVYRDTFVVAQRANIDYKTGNLVLLFQKNERDESLIPCPECRSHNVQGNSYPSIGVRSWECLNLLCPDRSKYNRGKRYSIKSLLMQYAIDDERNEIPVESVRNWMRDVQLRKSDHEILEMLIRHYSLCEDRVHLFNWGDGDETFLERRLERHSTLPELPIDEVERFFDGPFFSRYIVRRAPSESPCMLQMGEEVFNVLCGDAYDALRSFPADSFDAAITSPPYYNAREYAQWNNIYCYLYDMFNIAHEVFRCLKPGALYLYNIFDYFDNENIVALSAMGQKRMILSAYTVDMFRRIGFQVCGSVAWDKGDIEGKRGFNAGNFSPYYQAPFNCWEHILLFRKQEKTNDHSERIEQTFPLILRAQPVIKMVRGRNMHGHTAPFPDSLPELLVSQLPKGARVLDPFAGSLTTGRVAEKYGLASVCIERSLEYCNLGVTMREAAKEKEREAARQGRLL